MVNNLVINSTNDSLTLPKGLNAIDFFRENKLKSLVNQ